MQDDAGKARCWLKIALNNHTIESSIMVSADMFWLGWVALQSTHGLLSVACCVWSLDDLFHGV